MDCGVLTMTIKDNLNAAYAMWQMNFPCPRAYRWVKNYLSNLDNK